MFIMSCLLSPFFYYDELVFDIAQWEFIYYLYNVELLHFDIVMNLLSQLKRPYNLIIAYITNKYENALALTLYLNAFYE